MAEIVHRLAFNYVIRRVQHLQKEKYEVPALAALEIVWPVAAVLISSYMCCDFVNCSC